MNFIRFSLTMALFLFTAMTHAVTPLGPVLEADFDDQPLGPIGTGGAEHNQPVDLLNGLSAVVAADNGQQYLRLEKTGTSNELAVFEFIDAMEITAGTVRMHIDMEIEVGDYQIIYIRRQGSFAGAFANLRLAPAGQVQLWDAGNNSPQSIGTFSAPGLLRFILDFNMDSGTYSVTLNDSVLVEDRAHGVSSTQGIGRLNIGFSDLSAGDDSIALDRVAVYSEAGLDTLLSADFNDKAIGQPIGTDGAEAGEPVGFSGPNLITTEIIEADDDQQSLQVIRTLDSITFSALRWRFLSEVGVDRGTLMVDIPFRANQLERMMFSLRDRQFSSTVFQVNFDEKGNVVRGFPGGGTVVGSYQADQDYRLRLICDMDERHCSFLLDDQLLIDQHNVGHFIDENASIGSLLTGFLGNAEAESSFEMDSVTVYATKARSLPASASFFRQPTDVVHGQVPEPTVAVELFDAWGEPLADDATVALELIDGDPDATAVGLTALTHDGIAEFSELAIDRPGQEFRLRLAAGDLPGPEILSNTFDVLPGEPGLLLLTSQPEGGYVNWPLDPPIAVSVSDSDGFAVADGTEIAVSISEGPTGAELTGPTIGATEDGALLFPDLRLDRPGNYRLRAQVVDYGEVRAVTSSFSIMADVVFQDRLEAGPER